MCFLLWIDDIYIVGEGADGVMFIVDFVTKLLVICGDLGGFAVYLFLFCRGLGLLCSVGLFYFVWVILWVGGLWRYSLFCFCICLWYDDGRSLLCSIFSGKLEITFYVWFHWRVTVSVVCGGGCFVTFLSSVCVYVMTLCNDGVFFIGGVWLWGQDVQVWCLICFMGIVSWRLQ